MFVNWYAVLYAASLLLGCILLAITWRHRDRPGVGYALLFIAATAIWTLGDLLNVVLEPWWLKRTGGLLAYTGAVFVSPGWFCYVLVYTGNEEWLTRRALAGLFGFAVLVTAAFWTHPFHGLLFTGSSVHEPSGMIIGDPTAWLLPLMLYSYGLGIASFGLLLRELVVTHRFYRTQVVVLLLAMVAGWVTVSLFNLRVVGFDVTPIGYVVSGVALSWAVTRAGLMDIVPVARELVVDTVDAGIVVVDDAGNVVDGNPRATELLNVEGSLVGTELVARVEDPALAETVQELVGVEQEGSATVETGDRIVDVDASPLADRRGRFAGQVLLLTDVTEKRRRKRELERQNEQLEDFASLVSHDLRNPLNVAAGRAALLEDGHDPESVEKLTQALDRMDDIIDDVLTLAREGQSIEATEPVAIDDLADRAWDHVDTGEATLAVDTDLVVEADGDRLLRVFENLFRNAIEHGSPTVTVRVEAIDPESAGSAPPGPTGFAVEDDGPGIPEDEREDVFESGHTTNPDGTGFGLAIVRSIVDAHGWDVRVTEGRDGGARFEITGVSRAEPDAPAARAG